MPHLVRAPRLALSVVCVVAACAGAIIAAERSSSAMANAATAFVDSLTPEQRQQALFPFESDELTRWHFIPTEGFPRKGLTVKDMSEAQRTRAHALLKAGLSQRGYMTATAIMELESLLGALEQRDRDGGRQAEGFRRDPVRYFFSVFGTPSPKGRWGWRVEGHHVSLHFTVADGASVVGAPSFWGTNPAEVREGPKKGFRVLDREQDAGRALVMALDDAQKKAAIFAEVAPTDILTKTEVITNPLSPLGITSSAMTPKQRELLMQLIDVYTSQMTADIASERQAEIKKGGLDKIAFAWAGPVEPGQKHYYRVQGPTFVIEFDNTQNDGNHIHSVWRDFESDFGRDLLREHLAAVKH